jgi:hypothetical protein
MEENESGGVAIIFFAIILAIIMVGAAFMMAEKKAAKDKAAEDQITQMSAQVSIIEGDQKKVEVLINGMANAAITATQAEEIANKVVAANNANLQSQVSALVPGFVDKALADKYLPRYVCIETPLANNGTQFDCSELR